MFKSCWNSTQLMHNNSSLKCSRIILVLLCRKHSEEAVISIFVLLKVIKFTTLCSFLHSLIWMFHRFYLFLLSAKASWKKKTAVQTQQLSESQNQYVWQVEVWFDETSVCHPAHLKRFFFSRLLWCHGATICRNGNENVKKTGKPTPEYIRNKDFGLLLKLKLSFLNISNINGV